MSEKGKLLTKHLLQEINVTEKQKPLSGAFLVRNHLPMQEIQVRSLVWEDPTCCRATKPMRHNILASRSHNYWSPHALGPMVYNKRSHCNLKPSHHNWRVAPISLQLEKSPWSNHDPAQPKIAKLIKLYVCVCVCVKTIVKIEGI